MTVDQLVERFLAIALEQDYALLMDDTERFNRLYGKMAAISQELKSREGDQRRALLRLYGHRNAQVRVTAALATLAVSPQMARSALEAIRASQEQPQAMDAGMTLWNLDRGVFKPT